MLRDGANIPTHPRANGARSGAVAGGALVRVVLLLRELRKTPPDAVACPPRLPRALKDLAKHAHSPSQAFRRGWEREGAKPFPATAVSARPARSRASRSIPTALLKRFGGVGSGKGQSPFPPRR